MRKIAPAFFLLFAVAPLAAGLVYVLLYSLGLVGALSQGFTLDNWRNTLTNSGLWASLGLSALLATVVTLVSTALALWLTVWLYPLLQRPRVRFLLHFPLAVPPMVAAFVSFQWLGSSGMLARAAFALGWISQPDQFSPLVNDPWYLGVALTLVLTTAPFFLLLFLSHYQLAGLAQLSQAAATLGAAPRYIQRYVVAPVLLRRAAPTLLLYGIFLFGAYEVPLLLGRQNPALISVFIAQKFNKFNLSDLPVAYVATVLYAALVGGVVVLFLSKKRAETA